jgi:TatD DNase family protein
MVAECESQGVFTLAVTTTPRAWSQNQRIASGTKFVRVALGLHPQLVKDYPDEISLWREYLPEARYVGEVGLDAGPRFYSSFTRQKEVFAAVLKECATQGGKILTIHSVRAVRMVLDMIDMNLPRSRGVVVLHWFTGTKTEAERAVQMGAYFSINSEMLRAEKHRKMVAALPLDRLLTETDGPFTKVNGRPSRPSDIRQTVEELSAVLGIPAVELSENVANNLRRLVSDSG